MISYEKQKQLNKIKEKLLDIVLFPIRCICTPIYKLSERCKKNKRYPYKTILKLVQYCIDYHLNYDDVIYIVLDDFVPQEAHDKGCYSYRQLCDISWNHKRVKTKIQHIYYHQKDEYIKAVKEICGEPLTQDEKKKEFTCNVMGKEYFSIAYYRIQDKEVCKIIR